MLTRADLAGRKGIKVVHFDTSTHAVWTFEVDGLPRLSVSDEYERRTRKTERTWMVDGHDMPDLDTALAVLNGQKTIEEVEKAMQAPPPAERPKKSLVAQIAEVDYELKQREDVYKRIAANNPHRKGELELHTETMRAVRQTLVWLQDNELVIKARMAM